jgi:hypothetical protein
MALVDFEMPLGRAKPPALLDHRLQLKPGTGSLGKIAGQFLDMDPLLLHPDPG